MTSKESQMIKVLIVEDSLVEQELLTHLINADPKLQVLRCVKTGEEALSYVKTNRPDVITVDIQLPGMDGYQLTKAVMNANPIPIVIISGHFFKPDVQKSFQAIEAGAVSILEKPTGPEDPDFRKKSEEIRNHLKMAARIDLGRSKATSPEPLPKQSAIEESSNTRCVAIGGSLGGPQALKTILSNLPKDFPLPIFIVQHISPGFARGLVEWLNKDSPLPVLLGEHLQKGKGGTVYLAPDGYHMTIDAQNVIHLDARRELREIQPSVSKLFKSVATAHGAKAIGIILTGMGADGAKELLLMKQKGAVTIAQDQESCIMFGMPKEAIALGAAQYVVPLEGIPGRLIKLLNRGVR